MRYAPSRKRNSTVQNSGRNSLNLWIIDNDYLQAQSALNLSHPMLLSICLRYYPHHYSPFISDIRNFGHLKFDFELGKPFLPFQQLVSIMPTASKDLVPVAYRSVCLSVGHSVGRLIGSSGSFSTVSHANIQVIVDTPSIVASTSCCN